MCQGSGIQKRAMEIPLAIPCGRYLLPAAWRDTLDGVVSMPEHVVFWNTRKRVTPRQESVPGTNGFCPQCVINKRSARMPGTRPYLGRRAAPFRAEGTGGHGRLHRGAAQQVCDPQSRRLTRAPRKSGFRR